MRTSCTLRWWSWWRWRRLDDLLLGAAAVLDRGADDAAGVGDEIRYGEDATVVQDALGPRRHRDIGALEDDLGLELEGVGLGFHGLGERGGGRRVGRGSGAGRAR